MLYIILFFQDCFIYAKTYWINEIISEKYDLGTLLRISLRFLGVDINAQMSMYTQHIITVELRARALQVM